ncbi:MAG: Na+/H+ antiporter subunit G [Corynebacterium sp.]|uniref:Na+/H+ antiporter subunit G n=1 Tax=Corynebacterium sp. TaxID=1720 RepID=UPI0026DD9E77|nr:Na+/H+ antiporter subunit G [Corynebacterium sp.]MDO4761501.1 Na+/H+ antiporter subunit G [Corynebacterium sp.]
MIAELIAGTLIVLAGFLMLLTTVLVWRLRHDPLTCANLLGPATGVGLPLIIIAKLVIDFSVHGFSATDLLRGIGAIAGLLVVLAIGAFLLGRSLYNVASEQQSTPQS